MTNEEITEKLDNAEKAISTGDYDLANALAMELLGEIQTGPYRYQIDRVIGIVAMQRGDYSRALEYLNEALALCESLGMHHDVAELTGTIGSIYRQLANYAKALEYYTKALALCEEFTMPSGVVRFTGNIGLVYFHLADYPKALEYLSRTYAAYEKLGMKGGAATALSNIGVIYEHMLDYSTSLEYYTNALRMNEELGLKPNIALITGNIGSIYSRIEDCPKALEYLQRALGLYQELGMKQEVARIMNNLGSLYAKPFNPLYNVQQAESYLREAVTMNEELGTKNALYMNYLSLAELCEQEQRWQQSLEHYKKYHLLEKEVHNQEVKRNAELFDAERKTAEREKQLALSKEREHILNNILPEEITARLIKGENPIADHFECVSVLFMDITNFTVLSTKISAQQLVYLLNTVFTAADSVMRECGLEKIKTIGDAYMAVAGVPTVQEDHALRAAQAALKLVDITKNLHQTFAHELGEQPWLSSLPEIRVRIGLHCGAAAAGVVGENKFAYDLWGDTVNTASRMESHGEPGRIHASEDFVQQLSLGNGQSFIDHSSLTIDNYQLTIIPRGELNIKGKGLMRTFFLERG